MFQCLGIQCGISNVDETLEITLGNFTEDSRANALDNDGCKDDDES